jgi:hypothetical protein
VIEKVLEKSEFKTVDRFMKLLCDHDVMKGLIKNTYGFYVMQKLVSVLRSHKSSIKPVQQAIQDTIQYATDKTLRQKWQGILNQGQQMGSGGSSHGLGGYQGGYDRGGAGTYYGGSEGGGSRFYGGHHYNNKGGDSGGHW